MYVYTYRCMSCSCHWHTVHFMQLSLTIFEIPAVYISYNFPLTHIPRVNFIHLSTEIFPVCISMLSVKEWLILQKRHSYESPTPTPNQPNFDPLETMKNEERNNYHHAQMQKCILLKYLKEVWHRHCIHIYVYTVKIRQTRYTYHLFAAWIGGICWPKGFAYIYLS